MNGNVSSWLVFLLGGGLLASAVQANVITLNPVADAFVDSANPTSNYGAAGALAVAATGLPKGEFQSLLRFDTSSAKSSFDAAFGAGQWAIQSIRLRLTFAAPGNPIFNSPSAAGSLSTSWMQNDTWVEGTGTPSAPSATGITYNTLPSFLSGSDQALGTVSYNGTTSGTATYTLGLTSGLVGDINAGSLASLQLFAADANISMVCNSNNFTTVASRPLLSIDAVQVPEPASLTLLSFGGVLFSRRKRKQK